MNTPENRKATSWLTVLLAAVSASVVVVSAALFDWVYTTDVNKVQDYKAKLGHERVGVLAFAAQPSIHNPVRSAGWQEKGLRDVAFAGTYFAHKFPERRQQMLTAYRSYRTFLNVNSVLGSPSMCARRIFEITACGTAVLSAPSDAIAPFFPEGGVFVAEDEEGAYQWVRALSASPELRDHELKIGQRQIWKRNTYCSRVDQVLADVGLSGKRRPQVGVSVLVCTNRPHQLAHVVAQLAAQKGVSFEVLLTTHGFQATPQQRADAADVLPGIQWIHQGADVALGECYNRMVVRAGGDVVAKMDDDDLYGPHYLFDQLAALDYSGADGGSDPASPSPTPVS